jgi:hypothetical protein
MHPLKIGAGLALTAALVLTIHHTKSAIAQEASDGKSGVLVELFVSQGCDLCPTAEALAEKLAKDPRVVLVSWHVDYFDRPWKDPYSDPRHSARQAEYSKIYNRENGLNNPGYLYLTPLLLVDGRVPMVGSNEDAEAKARAAIAQRGRSRDALALGVKTAVVDGKLETVARVQRRRPAGSASELLVCLVIVENGLSTKVASGELEGKTYVGRGVARAHDVRTLRLPAGTEASASTQVSKLAIPPGLVAANAALVVLVQNESTGEILEARQLRWPGKP